MGTKPAKVGHLATGPSHVLKCVPGGGDPQKGLHFTKRSSLHGQTRFAKVWCLPRGGSNLPKSRRTLMSRTPRRPPGGRRSLAGVAFGMEMVTRLPLRRSCSAYSAVLCQPPPAWRPARCRSWPMSLGRALRVCVWPPWLWRRSRLVGAQSWHRLAPRRGPQWPRPTRLGACPWQV